MPDDVDIRIRTQGGPQARGEAAGVAKAIGNIGHAGMFAGRGVSGAVGAVGTLGRSLTSWQTTAIVGGLTAIGGAAVKMGIGFDASMEQNKVAFTAFLGSTQAATKYLGQLYTLAKETPFEFQDVVQGSRQLIGFGMSAKDAMSTMQGLGNAISATGASADSIRLATLAIGQIQSRGKLASQDFYQLTSAGVTGAAKMGKAYHESSGQFMADMQAGKISSTDFLTHLRKLWEKDPMYQGAAAKQAATFNGQLSTLHDNLAQTLGAVSYPGFLYLRNTVFPELNKAAGDLSTLFGRKDLTSSAKAGMAGDLLKRDLGPLASQLEQGLKDAHLDQKLGDVISWSVPRMADAAAHAAPKVVSAFVTGWLHAGPWGELLSAGFLVKKLGLVGKIGGLIGGRGRGGAGGVMGGLLAKGGSPANPMWVAVVGGGLPGAPGGKGGSRILDAAKRVVPFAARAPFATEVGAGLAGLATAGAMSGFLPGSDVPEGLRARDMGLPGRRTRTSARIPGTNLSVAVDPRLAGYPDGGAARTQRPDPRAHLNVTVPVVLNDREIAKAVARVAFDDRARK